MERREAMIGERLTALKPDTTIAQIARLVGSKHRLQPSSKLIRNVNQTSDCRDAATVNPFFPITANQQLYCYFTLP